MKSQRVIVLIVLVISILPFQFLYAFENVKTHPALTERATVASTIDDYLKKQLGRSDGINTNLSYNFPSEIRTRINRANWDGGKTQRTLLEWLEVGSAIEDEDTFPVHSIRARHHFYDPNRNAGLNNKDDNPDWTGWPEAAMGLIGSSALVWAVNGTALQTPTTNNQSWQIARTDFYNSLTVPLKSDREKHLAMAFLDLGCVLHMVEDMGVPAHTRNDFLFAHYRKNEDYGEPLEGWIERMIRSSGSLERWISAGWMPTPKVYGKVSNYFDTDTRNADNYLGDGALPPDTWGLSEATNYQFLSWTTIFRDTNSLYYFPHPAKIHTTEVNESGRIYLTGYGIDHLARQTMSYHYLLHDHLDKAWCVLGKSVYDDYAKMSLPRTINYATGLINYFFRGKLSIEQTDSTDGKIHVTITNKSSNSGVNQTLKGGTYTLYWDDSSGNRTAVSDFTVYRPGTEPASGNEWNSTTQMNYDESTKAVFTPPVSCDVQQYVLVYEGTISANPDSPDPYDLDAITVISTGAINVEMCSETVTLHFIDVDWYANPYVPHVISNGVDYVLTKAFCEDPHPAPNPWWTLYIGERPFGCGLNIRMLYGSSNTYWISVCGSRSTGTPIPCFEARTQTLNGEAYNLITKPRYTNYIGIDIGYECYDNINYVGVINGGSVIISTP